MMMICQMQMVMRVIVVYDNWPEIIDTNFNKNKINMILK